MSRLLRSPQTWAVQSYILKHGCIRTPGHVRPHFVPQLLKCNHLSANEAAQLPQLIPDSSGLPANFGEIYQKFLHQRAHVTLLEIDCSILSKFCQVEVDQSA